ncbi:hypothetical protein [Bradyrhizobium sp. AUGA SZCCT0283]|jgi:hypothetical protein|uniref:hypothetical protein n=1 Tax=Bradyrhizobium sp. AUGA SZCCT0283 TaxID=2807671 RepID=UPI001BA99DDF|nr:hypothetical protein [Bradyrhizobium sp. AUGA SZCCT0283]MBR1276892.1 hypothetical protein [Bradyrhizobium sp. AUGA SZCCT0283]
MRRVIAIAVTGASLAGCSSFSLDSFKPAPPLVKVALESVPPGADATTSLGPACKTPCSIDVPAPDAGFSVTFASPKFQPVTVPVQVIRNPGDFASPATTIIEPSPVFAELKPTAPPPKARKPMRPKPKKPKAAAAAPAPGSAFPNPAPAQPASR